MSATVRAAARTPWLPRDGEPATLRPEMLLGAALDDALRQSGSRPDDVDLLLVACDTAVGALDLNIARRAALELGWARVPALTVDGQRCGDLGLLGLAAGRPGVTVVAAVDLPSTVPPGAGLVRDYGRPTMDAPEYRDLEAMAHANGIGRARLDDVVRSLCARRPLEPMTGIVGIERGGAPLTVDPGVRLDAHPEELLPLGGDDGLVTAFHETELADGAVAVVVEPDSRADEHGRTIVRHAFAAVAADDVVPALVAWADAPGPVFVAEANAVVHALTGCAGDDRVGAVPAIGSAPSGDGLRMLCDAYHAVDEAFTVTRRGALGQVALVELGPRRA